MGIFFELLQTKDK